MIRGACFASCSNATASSVGLRALEALRKGRIEAVLAAAENAASGAFA